MNTPQFQQLTNSNFMNHVGTGSTQCSETQPSMAHTVHLQSMQPPSYHQSEYYFNRSRQLAMQSSMRYP